MKRIVPLVAALTLCAYAGAASAQPEKRSHVASHFELTIDSPQQGQVPKPEERAAIPPASAPAVLTPRTTIVIGPVAPPPRAVTNATAVANTPPTNAPKD
jgi:hypothetical protein